MLQSMLLNGSPAVGTAFCNANQCNVLIDAMQKMGTWLVRWESQEELQLLVLDMLRIEAKGRSLLEECQDSTKNWVVRALAKEDSKEDFLDVLQGFIPSLETIGRFGDCVVDPRRIRVRQDWLPDCIKEAASLALMLKNVHVKRLADAAKADRQDLICKLAWLTATSAGPASRAQNGRGAGTSATVASQQQAEQVEIAQFLLAHLQMDERRHRKPFRVVSPLPFLHQIGEGASAVVHEVEWQGTHVAMKKFSHKTMFDAEMHVMQSLAHVNVTRVIGYHVTGGRVPKHCLLMECMKSDLETFINALMEELPLAIAIEILLQVAKGMDYLHMNNIIHRDLKPRNILLDHWPGLNGIYGYFTAKITDFGNSRTDFNTMATTHVTRQCGTTNYMAPEVWDTEGVDGHTSYSKKVDVYSFGMVCYKVLTRKTPGVHVRDAREGQRPDAVFLSRCPKAIVLFMQRCWDGDAKKRPSFSEICNFLTVVKSLALTRHSALQLNLDILIKRRYNCTFIGTQYAHGDDFANAFHPFRFKKRCRSSAAPPVFVSKANPGPQGNYNLKKVLEIIEELPLPCQQTCVECQRLC